MENPKTGECSPNWEYNVLCNFRFSGTVQLEYLIKRLIQKEIEQENNTR